MATKNALTRTNETLYAVAWVVADEPEYDSEEAYLEALAEQEAEAEAYEPEGWREYAIERWGLVPPTDERWPNGYKPFFWPSTKRLYTTRKAAEGRRDLINHWGGDAVVVVAEIDWVPVEEMDARWKRERLEQQRRVIDAELAKMDGPDPWPLGA